MRISSFKNTLHILLQHPSSGLVVPIMTQIAVLRTALALNHPSVWWKCHGTPSECLLLNRIFHVRSPFLWLNWVSHLLSWEMREGSLCWRGWLKGSLSGVVPRLGIRALAVLRACANWSKEKNPTFIFPPSRSGDSGVSSGPVHCELTFCTDVLSVTWKTRPFQNRNTLLCEFLPCFGISLISPCLSLSFVLAFLFSENQLKEVFVYLTELTLELWWNALLVSSETLVSMVFFFCKV